MTCQVWPHIENPSQDNNFLTWWNNWVYRVHDLLYLLIETPRIYQTIDDMIELIPWRHLDPDEEEEIEEEIDVVQESRKDIKATCSSPLSVSFGNADELLLMLKQFRSGSAPIWQFVSRCLLSLAARPVRGMTNILYIPPRN